MGTPKTARTLAPGRLLAAIGALALGLALLAVPASAQEDDPDVQPARVEGADRFETAANIATATFDSADIAHVVTGEDYPDALAASYGAGVVEGPVLLVTRDGVPQATWAALEALDVERIVIIGGQSSVSAAVQEEFEEQGYDAEPWRISGADRYETAAAVAMTYGPEQVGTVEGERTAILASGTNFADALAAGPLAASVPQLPLLLTPPDSTHPIVNGALDGLDIERIIVAGGTAAVSSAVVAAYQDAGYTVERISGADRTATAAAVATNADERFGFTVERVLLARGDDYPDALTAAVHGGLLGAPLLLTHSPTQLSGHTGQWLADACPDVEIIRAIGGTGAVSIATLDEAVNAAESCHEAPENNQSFIISPQEHITADTGDEFTFELAPGTYDDEPVEVAEVALFPCTVVDTSTSLITFEDRGDGYAVGSGQTDSSEAWISHIDGHPQGTIQQTRDRAPSGAGATWTITSNAPDCTVLVAWGPGSDDELEIPLDAAGEPEVRFGIGVIEFRAA